MCVLWIFKVVCLVLCVHSIAFYKLLASCDEFLKSAGGVCLYLILCISCTRVFWNIPNIVNIVWLIWVIVVAIIGFRSTCLFVSKVRIFACVTVWIIVVQNGCVYTGTALVCTFDIGGIWCNRKYVNRLLKMGLDVMVFRQFRCFLRLILHT